MTQQSSSYVLDEGNECLWRDGRRIDLQPKVFRLLQHLSRQPGQLVSKRALLDEVWADTHVSESPLSVAIAQLRDQLGDDPRAPRFIETEPRLRGFEPVAQFQIGFVELGCGRFESAIANLQPAVDLPSLVPQAPVDLNLAAIGNIALARFLLGSPAEALQEANTACERAAEIGLHHSVLLVAPAAELAEVRRNS